MGNQNIRAIDPQYRFGSSSSAPYDPKGISDDGLITEVFNDTGTLPNKVNENIEKWIQNREITGYASKRKRVNVSQRYLPVSGRVLMRYSNRVFCGSFSTDGSIYMSATQDRRIRFYDTRSWKKTKEVIAGDVGWSIIDTDFSPDQRWLIYSGWSDDVNLCNVVGEHEVHDHLKINHENYNFCLFSVKFSPDSNEIVGGSNDNCLYIYDLNRRERVLRLQAHDNDINTVAYAEENNNNLILSGGDDCLCMMWDRRLMGNNSGCVGTMVGHNQGITHINPKGDGRYFISNGKDQCIKLWDIRKMTSSTEGRKFSRDSYDYRYGVDYREKLDQSHDTSLMTYRSHTVTRTLIRSYFSPKYSTGQRFIYSGSADGIIYVYDLVSGKVVAKLEGHTGIVRDASWHPFEPILLSASWDCSVASWDHLSATKSKSFKSTIDEDETYNYD